MKIAFASDDGEHVNTHFGFCEKFEIYEVTAKLYERLPAKIVEANQFIDEFGRIESRVNAVKDCTLLFITQIGPAAAARVTRNKIMPIKVDDGTKITEQLERLMTMLKNRPPLWLAKAINESAQKDEVYNG